MSNLIAATGAWASAHPFAFAWLCAAALSVLAYVIHLPKVQAWLVRYPLAQLLINIVARRLLAFAAAIGGDVPKALAALFFGQAPTAPAPIAPITVDEVPAVLDVLSKKKGV